ncbi:MAG: nuclear transport factor 2 family protein [Dehalococcoidia bacterium]|nr:nuclear transport factor 2 family protein [Dehalococcoidia bacterium]
MLSFPIRHTPTEECAMPVGPNDLETARKLFEEGGWSSGDPYGPDQWFAEDAVMRDIVGHEDALRGHEEIRQFWASQKVGITLRVPVEELYVAEGHRGVAVLWMAYGQIMDEESDDYGRWASFEGMSRLEFNDDGEVTLEVDYHHGGQGIVDSWVAHWNARRARPWKELGEITGA